MYYLYLWLQEKPDVTNIVAPNLPEEVFIESTKTPFYCPSPTGSNTTHQTLVESVNALAAASKIDDVVKWLLDTKQQLQTEADNGVQKLLQKYEKKLMKELNFSSDSEDDNSSSSNAD